MNKTKLKNYAPKARRDFIQAVIDRAAYYGVTKDNIAKAEESGDVVVISGQAFPKSVAVQREGLITRINASSFEQVMEESAYVWFNRFVAIRYMELHGYLSHGYRGLSNPDADDAMPEILDKAQHVEFSGLKQEKVLELKMEGTKDEELYRMLLIAQCNELSKAMPFLFERIEDYTELLLPDNLLHSGSLIRQLVNEIDEGDWQEVEIIGWLYQFYISEKKDEVIGKVVKSEDIPAATQLFTPNWIVKYLVQNSLGAQWMRTYPNSSLKENMEYYIEPAEQNEEVQKQLSEITPDSLNPEELTLLDPACGSGHILVEAYDLLMEIYLERGYQQRKIPELILQKNLFGLEIDDRAAQLAGFALKMKARVDDRRLFEKGIQPNIVSIQESKDLDIEDIVTAIKEPLTTKVVADIPRSMEELQTAIEAPLFAGEAKETVVLDEQEKLTVDDMRALLSLFEHGKTFGSLIRIPEKLAQKLSAMAAKINVAYESGNLSAFEAAKKIMPFVNQAQILAGKYDSVAANPPYMGRGSMSKLLMEYSNSSYCDTKSDLFSMFIERAYKLAKSASGHIAMVTMQSWMFLSSYETMRSALLENKTINSMAHLGPRAFSTISGEVVTVTAFSLVNKHFGDYRPTFLRLVDGDEQAKAIGLRSKRNRFDVIRQNAFSCIPCSPLAYWVSERVHKIFSESHTINDIGKPRRGLQTGNGPVFIRYWHEVDNEKTFFRKVPREECIASSHKWYMFNNGGEFRKWYGTVDYVVNWENNGFAIKSTGKAIIPSESMYFFKALTWSRLSGGKTGFRLLREGILTGDTGPCIFLEDGHESLLGFLNSTVAAYFLKIIVPNMTFLTGDIGRIPILQRTHKQVKNNHIIQECVVLGQEDWNSIETSWEFKRSPLLEQKSNLKTSYDAYLKRCKVMTTKIKNYEEENNRLFIQAYGLEEELKHEVSDEQITLFANPKYRYGGNLSSGELEKRFKEDTIKELLSYSIGCMMGRYSLDEPGLIYAHSGNEGFDSNKHMTFPADDDGVIPITDFSWFADDVAERFFKFVETVWSKNTLDENLDFSAEAIGRKSSESTREAIRRFFSNDFFKDHLKRYKKRPIYWLFASGKEKAIQFLVYLHRYNEGTLARLRTEYLIPLQGKIRSHIESLNKDIDHASSTSGANKLRKEISKLEKQAEELRKYDEKLRHYADMKIRLDLDDGVKVNYGKFGDLLAEVKAVTGK